MQAYLLQILAVSLVCGWLEMLAPAGEREGLRTAVRTVAALCLLSLMIAPLGGVREVLAAPDLAAWLGEALTDSEAAEEDLARLMERKLTAVSEEQLAEAVAALLNTSFGIARQDHTADFAFETGSEALAVREVWIALRGRAVLCDPREIEQAVEALLGCPCRVSVG